MSVINKMLRDLDRRQVRAPGASAPAGGSGVIGVRAFPATSGFSGGAGAASTGAPAWRSAPVGKRLTLWLGLGLFVLLAASVGWWMQQRGDLPGLSFKVSVATTHTTQAPAPAAPSTAASSPNAVASAETNVVNPLQEATSTLAAVPVLVADANPPSGVVSSSTTAVALTSSPAAPAQPVLPVPSPKAQLPERPLVPSGLKMETTLALRKAVDSTRPLAGAAGVASAQELPDARPPASQEALLRAQNLWNAGSREAAMDWLQEAISVAERSPVAANTPAGNPLLLPLVREQARMQLAEARYTAIWEMLSRLEPQLGTAPDLWAIRANAAQRLGRHQDSVHAYMMALQARPDEQRWMLGAAVSLAALGQITSAADMAERARAMGIVSKDVLAYLRQMGVPLK